MKLLLADDLRSMHRYLVNCIDWSQECIQEIYHAYDGQECVDLTERYRPDILLLDIKMPVFDGLEVLRILSERDCMPHVLIISAYGDFQYARQALKFGVIDYITKPLDVPSLLQNIRQITTGIRKQCMDRLRADLLDLPIIGKTSYISEDMQRLGIRKAYCALIAFSGNMPLIQGYSAQLLADYPYSVALSETSLFVILPCDTVAAENDIHELEVAVMDLAKENKVRVSAGISRLLDLQEDGTLTAYNQCNDAVTCRYFQEKVVFHYDDLAFGTINQDVVSQCKLMLTKSLLEGNEEIHRKVDQIFDELSKQSPERKELVDVCYSILVYCSNYLFISYNHAQPLLSERRILEKLDSCGSVDELKATFLAVLKENMSKSEQGKSSAKSQLIYDLETYLAKNYMKSLTLENLSNRFFVSKYELCRKFKAEMGENLWEYLAGIRIQQAKILLQNSDLRISEIAERVGYRDPTYFSNMFKKQVGVSPKQYRSR